MSGRRQIATLLSLSLATSALGAGLASAAQSVHVTLQDSAGAMEITTSPETVQTGRTTFEVANKSSGVEHEFLVARIETDPAALAFDETLGVLKESAMQDVTELGDLAAGGTGVITLDLKPGKYLLFCNLPGHFRAGMYRVLTVTQ